MTYTATATREGGYWVVAIDGVGSTQARSVTEARRMAADLVLAMKDEPDAEVNLRFHGGVLDDVEEVRSKRLHAEKLSAEATSEMRALVRRLVNLGVSGSDIAQILGVSPQRASQLIHATERHRVKASGV